MLSTKLHQKLEANLRYLIVQKASVTAYFHIPIIVLYWQDLGLSMLQIMLLQAAFSIATVTLELPSGIFADIYGRKLSLILASLCSFVGISLYCVADGFFSLLFAEMFLAGFIAMQSGADSAFLYDNLKVLKRDAEYAHLLGNLIFYSTIVMAAFHIIGGFVGAVDLRLAIYCSVPFVFTSVIAAMLLTEPPVHSAIISERKTFRGQITDIVQTIRLDNGLLWLLIYAGIVFSFNLAGLWLYQPYFSITGIDVMWFGLIFASFQIVAAYAGKYYHIAKARFGEPRLLIALIILTCTSSIMLGQVLFLFSFTLIFLHQIVRGFYKIIFADIINRRVESNVRASVLSIQSLAGRLLTALMMPFFGWYADVYSIEETFTLIGIIGLACGLPILWMLSRFELRD